MIENLRGIWGEVVKMSKLEPWEKKNCPSLFIPLASSIKMSTHPFRGEPLNLKENGQYFGLKKGGGRETYLNKIQRNNRQF